MVEATVERGAARPGNLITIYLIAVALGLTTLGLVMLFSAGVAERFTGPHGLLVKQIIWLGLSFLIGLYVAFMNLDWLRKHTWWIFGICVIALILTLIPGIGIKVNGAQRWIGLGPLRIQPSEFAKIGLVFGLAAYFSSKQREIKTALHGFFVPPHAMTTFLIRYEVSRISDYLNAGKR